MRAPTWLTLALAVAACGDAASNPGTDATSGVDATSTVDVTTEDATTAPDVTAEDATTAPDGTEDATTVADGDVADDALDPFDRAPAALRVTESAWVGGSARTNVGGVLWSSEPPENWVLAGTSGACRLWLGQNPFCAEPCDGALCTAADVCTPYPAAESAGELAVSDGATTLAYRFDGQGYGEAREGATFAAGATIAFSAAGDAFPAFSGAVAMPPKLVAGDLGALALLGADPVVLTWEPPPEGADDTRIRIRLEADRGQHGRLPTAALECEVPDTGRFAIPEDLRAQYVATELWGCGKCPASSITRYRRVRVAAGARVVDLYAESEVTFLLVAR